MAARRYGLRLLSSAAPLISGSSACSASRAFSFLAAAEQPVTGVLRRTVLRSQSWQPQLWPLGVRGFAKLPPHIELTMPSLSPTMNQGNIAEWKLQEGQEVAAGDVIAEVETDKATMDWESQDDGYVAKILVPGGTKDIKVGTTVAIIVEEKDDAAAFADYKPGEGSAAADEGGDSAPQASGGQQEAPKEAPASGGGGDGGSFPPHIVLNMPALSPTMSAGNIAQWKVEVGSEVAAGDCLAEVETDKATMDWESQDDGFIAKILVASGAQNVDVNTPVAVIVEEKGMVDAFKDFTADHAAGGGAPPAQQEAPAEMQEAAPAPKKQEAAAATEAPSKPSGERVFASPYARKLAREAGVDVAAASTGERVFASPYARKLAREAGVDVAAASGSGPNGRITAADVEELLKSGGGRKAKTQPQQPTAGQQGGGAEIPARREGGYTDIPNSNIRRITAARLLESKQSIPHYYLTSATRVDKLMALRKQINDALAQSGGGKLSVNDFIVKAAALALRDVPEVNSAWMGDFIRQYDSVDVSVAVQTPNGLMVPVLRNADELGLQDINAAVKNLANKAKAGKLTPDEMTGGTFTISNLGMFGVDQFAAIINPPQVCILAVGSAVEKVIKAPDGSFQAVPFINATLSCDHRVVDGALGAQWLQAFKTRVEDPLTGVLV